MSFLLVNFCCFLRGLSMFFTLKLFIHYSLSHCGDIAIVMYALSRRVESTYSKFKFQFPFCTMYHDLIGFLFGDRNGKKDLFYMGLLDCYKSFMVKIT